MPLHFSFSFHTLDLDSSVNFLGPKFSLSTNKNHSILEFLWSWTLVWTHPPHWWGQHLISLSLSLSHTHTSCMGAGADLKPPLQVTWSSKCDSPLENRVTVQKALPYLRCTLCSAAAGWDGIGWYGRLISYTLAAAFKKKNLKKNQKKLQQQAAASTCQLPWMRPESGQLIRHGNDRPLSLSLL